MPKYNCSVCNYDTKRKSNYIRHNVSKNHLQKVNKPMSNSKSIPMRFPSDSSKFICEHCKNGYASQSNLTRHSHKCTKKKIKQITEENEMDALKNKVIRIQQHAKEEKKRIQQQAKEKEKQYQKQLETYEHMLKSFTTPQTINYFNYIVQNYPNAPALECQESYDNLIEAKTMTLVEVISMYHYDKKLVHFIGDYIVKIYTHKEPKKQSICLRLVRYAL
jgi:transketolase